MRAVLSVAAFHLLILLAGPAPAAPATPASEIAVRRLFDKPMDFLFEGIPLGDILKYFSEVQPGLNIVVGPDVAAAGIDVASHPVTLKLRRVPIGIALGLVLGEDLGYVVEPGRVRVATREKLLEEVASKNYPVQALAARMGPAAGPALAGLPDVVKLAVDHRFDPLVAVWNDEGGSGACSIQGTVLTVVQTRRGHEAVADLLKDIEQALSGRPAPAVPPTAEGVALAGTRALLDRNVDVEFAEVPLRGALEHLAEVQPGLNFVIDPAVPAAGVNPDDRRVTLKVRQVPVKSVLDQLVAQDLGWAARPGHVLVTTRQKAHGDLAPAVLPLPRAAGRPADAAAVIETIRQMVRGGRGGVAEWRADGGPADLLEFGSVLIVVQTPEGQQKVKEMLGRMPRR